MGTRIELSPAPEAERIGTELVGQYHPHLLATGILYVFTTQERKEDRKPVAATIQKLTPMQRYLMTGSALEGEQFVVLINRERWRDLLGSQRRALIDHELLHLVEKELDPDDEEAEPEVVWSAGHDAQVFADELRRHGAWHDGIQMIAKQLSLFEADQGAGAPKRGQRSGIDSITFETDGKSVTLTKDTGAAIGRHLASERAR